MKILAAALAILLPSAAVAQATKCGNEFGKWVCRTEPAVQQPNIYGAGMDAFNKQTQRYQEMQREAEARRATDALVAEGREAQRRADHQRMVQGEVSEAIREHRCAEAKDIALANGDMNLAEQAQRLCTPAP